MVNTAEDTFSLAIPLEFLCVLPLDLSKLTVVSLRFEDPTSF